MLIIQGLSPTSVHILGHLVFVITLFELSHKAFVFANIQERCQAAADIIGELGKMCTCAVFS